jgi:hypothetical protein
MLRGAPTLDGTGRSLSRNLPFLRTSPFSPSDSPPYHPTPSGHYPPHFPPPQTLCPPPAFSPPADDTIGSSVVNYSKRRRRDHPSGSPSSDYDSADDSDGFGSGAADMAAFLAATLAGAVLPAHLPQMAACAGCGGYTPAALMAPLDSYSPGEAARRAQTENWAAGAFTGRSSAHTDIRSPPLASPQTLAFKSP